MNDAVLQDMPSGCYATRYGREANKQIAHDTECDGDGRGTGLPEWKEPVLPIAAEIAYIFEVEAERSAA